MTYNEHYDREAGELAKRAEQLSLFADQGASVEDLHDRVSYSIDEAGKAVLRWLELSDGNTVQSRVELPPCHPYKSDAHALFDWAWLRCKSFPPNDSRDDYRVADLFSGCGGLSLGVWEACRAVGKRFVSVLAMDEDENALEVYRTNFDPLLACSGDVLQVFDGAPGTRPSRAEAELLEKVGEIDLLVGGPPCQGHSDLNNHTRRDDSRNALMGVVVRCAELTHPQHVIIENVQGVIHDRQGNFAASVMRLSSLGYQVQYGLLEAQDLGVPQRRRRCFVLASKSATPSFDRIRSAHQTAERSFDWACADLELINSEDLFDSAASVSVQNQSRIEYLFDHELFELPDEQRPDCHRLKPHGYSSVYGRMRPEIPAPTITTGFGSPGQGRFVHPRQRRTLTPHEAARLQTIPDFFRFTLAKRKKLQKLLGNAVPPKLAFAVALELLTLRD